MKVLKDGKLKLDRNDRRVGNNMVVRDDGTHMKVMDIGQVFTHRADKRTPVGQFLQGCFLKLGTDESTGKGLANWLAVMFSVFSVVPDIEFLDDVYKASEACMKRHPEAYGLPDQNISDEKDAQIIQEEREIAEFEEQIKNLPDGNDDKKD